MTQSCFSPLFLILLFTYFFCKTSFLFHLLIFFHYLLMNIFLFRCLLIFTIFLFYGTYFFELRSYWFGSVIFGGALLPFRQIALTLFINSFGLFSIYLFRKLRIGIIQFIEVVETYFMKVVEGIRLYILKWCPCSVRTFVFLLEISVIIRF